MSRLIRCPRCNSILFPAECIAGGPSTDWYECSNSICNTFVDAYHPMPHQASVHLDKHHIIGNFGSYGTGKTKTSEKEIEKHIFITPGANILIGANVTSQYEQTILRDFERSFPAAFVETKNVQKAYTDFINGARLMMRPMDDPNKMKSYNISMGVIVEASECIADSYHQLKTRLRNTEATRYDPAINTLYDWRKLICESNPDSGWIRTDLLLVADDITQHGKFCKDEYKQEKDEIDKNISVHVASTDVNTFLPKDYIELNSKNKPDWWVKRFIHGSFLFAEGLVYPSYAKAIVPTPMNFKLLPKWKVIASHDYGLQDPSTFEFGYIDQDRGKLVIYKDVRTNETSVKDLADIFKREAADVQIGQWYTTPIIDPKNNKRDYDKKDLITHYQEYGVSFQPGFVNRETRLFRLNDYFEQGRIEIFDSCVNLIRELREYKFKNRTLNDPKNAKDEPIEKDDHSICGIEWMTMMLPADPKKLFLDAYNSKGESIEVLLDNLNKGGWQLSEPDTYKDYSDQGYGIEGGGLYG